MSSTTSKPRAAQTDKAVPLGALPAWALRAALDEGYGPKELKNDLLAGAIVGVIAVPLAMALSIAVGVAPQSGLQTAIFAGFFAALLGGSKTQVTGPTAAFVVVLAPIHEEFGLAGLLISGLFGGVLLVAMGLLRLGRLIQFVPYPVTNGFTAGIAIVLCVLQIKDFFGLTIIGHSEHFFGKLALIGRALHTARASEMLVGAFTLALLILLPKVIVRIPSPLLALPAASVVALVLGVTVPGWEIDTIASRFHYVVDGTEGAGIPRQMANFALPWSAPGPDGAPLSLDFSTLRALLLASLAVAMLGAIESLLSAVVADGMARTRHEPDSELIAQGVANLLVPFFGGIAATGAIARTATNVKMGARSPVAAMTHALVVVLAVVLLAPLLGYLPMASLAALLLLVAWNMSEVRHVVNMIRVAPKSDVAVLFTCLSLTVGFDMVVGVSVGMVLASFLFMRRMAEVTQIRSLWGGGQGGDDLRLPPSVEVYEISGPLFFGAAQKAMATLEIIGEGTRTVIVDMSGVNAIDATGLVALESAVQTLASRKCPTILTKVQPQPKEVLRRANLKESSLVYNCDSLLEAVDLAERLLGRSPGGGDLSGEDLERDQESSLPRRME